jgi:serine/threonine-protein kinase
MAPEQARGLAIDHRADLYSLGVTYYRILSGKLPFTGKDAREIMEKQVFEPPEPLKRLEPRLPPMVYFVIDRLLRKRPAERYPTASALVKDIERALQEVLRGATESSEQQTKVTSSSGRQRPSSKRDRESGGKGLFKRFMI